MSAAATPETVMAAYAERINQHDFSLLAPLIAENAVFWFSSGSYVGLDQARRAFERTWHRLQNETYWLASLTWIAKGDNAASCTYHFHWRAIIDGIETEGTGRGTTVLAKTPDGWRIIHEHLSAFPT